MSSRAYTILACGSRGSFSFVSSIILSAITISDPVTLKNQGIFSFQSMIQHQELTIIKKVFVRSKVMIFLDLLYSPFCFNNINTTKNIRKKRNNDSAKKTICVIIFCYISV